MGETRPGGGQGAARGRQGGGRGRQPGAPFCQCRPTLGPLRTPLRRLYANNYDTKTLTTNETSKEYIVCENGSWAVERRSQNRIRLRYEFRFAGVFGHFGVTCDSFDSCCRVTFPGKFSAVFFRGASSCRPFAVFSRFSRFVFDFRGVDSRMVCLRAVSVLENARPRVNCL